jgi:hypothetical protein
MTTIHLKLSSVEELMLKEVMKHKKVNDKSRMVVDLIRKKYDKVKRS